jgi:uncharacterized heparinase superfamily protein
VAAEQILERVRLTCTTAGHLRLRQITGRAARNVSRALDPLYRRRDELRREDDLITPCFRPAYRQRLLEAGGLSGAELLYTARAAGRGVFRFLNLEAAPDPTSWRAEGVPRLWHYHLHYFAYATDLAYAAVQTGEAAHERAFARLVGSWLDSTSRREGDAWDPYPTSLRIMNWVRALELLEDRVPADLRARMYHSMRHQLEHLTRNLEVDLQANHLFMNYAALAIGGAYADPTGRRGWRELGQRGLRRELLEQFNPDGGHYERSPMYHANVLGTALEALHVLGHAEWCGDEEVVARLERAVAFARAMRSGDGTGRLFNDSTETGGIRPAALDVWSRGLLHAAAPAPLLRGARCFPDTGFHGVVTGAGDSLWVDASAPAPAHQPGHAHNGLLGFVLDVGGLPVVVDSGVHGYDGDPFRAYSRGTAAHSTLSIAGREQSEMWSTFRVARRALLHEATCEGEPDAWRFTGAYSPYWDRRVTHRRTIEQAGPRAWRVCDDVLGCTGAPVTSRIRLHPECELRREEGLLRVRRGSAALVIRPFGIEEMQVTAGASDPCEGWYLPDFGVAIPSPTVLFRGTADTAMGYSLEVEA